MPRSDSRISLSVLRKEWGWKPHSLLTDFPSTRNDKWKKLHWLAWYSRRTHSNKINWAKGTPSETRPNYSRRQFRGSKGLSEGTGKRIKNNPKFTERAGGSEGPDCHRVSHHTKHFPLRKHLPVSVLIRDTHTLKAICACWGSNLS